MVVYSETRLATTGGEIWACVHGANQRAAPLLVLHGGPGFLSMPETVCALSNERPVWFYDQLGCGRSSHATTVDYYTPERYVEELAEVRAQLGIGECHLMGFSWGAMLAALYLTNMKPLGIRSLILSAPLLSAPRWEADARRNISKMPDEFRSAIETAERTGVFGPAYQEAVMAYYHRHLCLLDPWPDFVQSALGRMNAAVYNRLWGPSEFTVTGMLKGCDLFPRLGEIETPVLLTCGDRDEAGVATIDFFRSALHDADMAVLPHASHLHHIERPALFLSIIRDFLSRVEAA